MEHELNLVAIIAVAAALLSWSVLGPRLARWNISAPMFFVAVGLVMANAPGGPLTLHVGGAGIRSLAEVTLAIVLFGDAAAVRARALRRDVALPGRLLGIGQPSITRARYRPSGGHVPASTSARQRKNQRHRSASRHPAGHGGTPMRLSGPVTLALHHGGAGGDRTRDPGVMSPLL